MIKHDNLAILVTIIPDTNPITWLNPVVYQNVLASNVRQFLKDTPIVNLTYFNRRSVISIPDYTEVTKVGLFINLSLFPHINKYNGKFVVEIEANKKETSVDIEVKMLDFFQHESDAVLTAIDVYETLGSNILLDLSNLSYYLRSSDIWLPLTIENSIV
jgi:hypothetical protein